MATDDHKGLPVSGYKPQSTVKVDEVNLNKALEEALLRRIENLQREITLDCDARLLALARTQFEIGFMWLNRAIFKPGRLTTEEMRGALVAMLGESD